MRTGSKHSFLNFFFLIALEMDGLGAIHVKFGMQSVYTGVLKLSTWVGTKYLPNVVIFNTNRSICPM